MKKIFTAIALLGISSSIIAQRLLTEDFNYPTGALTTAGGGNVSGGNWVNTSGTVTFLQVTAGSLSYTGYGTGASSTNNNKVSMTATSSSAEDAMRSFAAQTGGTVYASFLMNVIDQTRLLDNTSAAGDFFFAFLSTGSTSNFNAGRVYVRKGVAANTINLGVSVSTTAQSPIVYAPLDYAVGTTHLVTLAFTSVAGTGNDTAKLFVDRPESLTEPLVPDAVSALIPTSTVDPVDVSAILLREGTNTPNVDVDAIKVSTNYYDATLPVTLTSFKGSLFEKSVQLSWTSSNEQNVATYTIERSGNSRSFNSIGNITAQNVDKANYSFVDASPLTGAGYYRLKISDKDGAIKYSGIISINSRKSISAAVFPNPAINNITISHSKAEKGATLIITNTFGQQVRTITVQPGALQTSLAISDLLGGQYMIVFDNNGDRASAKFLKN
jgi:hypothetical protein